MLHLSVFQYQSVLIHRQCSFSVQSPPHTLGLSVAVDVKMILPSALGEKVVQAGISSLILQTSVLKATLLSSNRYCVPSH